MSKKKTHSEFVQEVYLLVKDEYSILGEYKTAKEKVSMLHNNCGIKYEVQPDSFLRGVRCPKCFGTPRKTTDQFIKEVFNKRGDDFKVLGEYKTNGTNILVKHTRCGHEWECTPANLLKGRNCPVCSLRMVIAKGTKTTDFFKKEVHELVDEEYLVVGEYKGANINIRMIHNTCGSKMSISPSSFLMGHRCHICSTIRISNLRRKSTEQFKLDIYKLVGNEYTVLGEYTGANDKVLMRHSSCNHEWGVWPNAFFRGNRCPRCSESHGEKAVTKYLQENCIYFKRQLKFIECKDKRQLPFDFAIFNKEKLLALIGYDREQHFKPVKHFGGEKQLIAQQHYDAIKTNYCLSMGIPLIRIPYTVTDIGEYLGIEISKLKEQIQLTLTI